MLIQILLKFCSSKVSVPSTFETDRIASQTLKGEGNYLGTPMLLRDPEEGVWVLFCFVLLDYGGYFLKKYFWQFRFSLLGYI